MKRKNLLILFAVLLLIPASAFALPHLAVLDAVLDAGIDPSAGPLVTSKIEEAFVNSGKYTVLDRANIDRVLLEKEFQLSSGIVRNEEVRQAGEYLGADVVVVATVSRIGQTYVVSAKMIDVVSGEIAAQTSSEKAGRIDVLLEVARVVGGRLAGTDIFIVSVDEQRAQEIVREEKKEERPREEVVEEEPEVVEEEEEEEYVPLPPRKKPWEKNLILGVRGGVNRSTIAWDDFYFIRLTGATISGLEDPAAVAGLNAGFYVVVNTGRYLAWQIELDYSQKGYSVDFFENGWGVTESFVFNYLEVPLLMKLKVPATVSPYAVLGLYMSLWLNGTIAKDYYELDVQDEFDWSAFFDYTALDLGWVAGVGVDLFVGSLVLNVELKYSGGVFGVTSAEDFRNATLTATAGIGFAF